MEYGYVKTNKLALYHKIMINDMIRESLKHYENKERSLSIHGKSKYYLH